MAGYDAFAWYHGKVDRSRAEDLLRNKHTGTYLVRDSTSIPGDFVLSVRENTMQGALCSHYIINVRKGLYKIGDQTFHSLPEVIDFYRNHYLDTTILTEIARKDAFASPAGPPRGPEQHPPVPGEICRVRALYRFQSSDQEDLEFEKDDIMIVLRKGEDAWWHARHTRNGREGSIPVPYIEVIQQVSPAIPAQRPAVPRQSSLPGAGSSFGASGNSTAFSPPSQPAAATPPSQTPAQPQTSNPTRALAIMDRTGNVYDSTALSFKAGDTITVLQQNENGLWEGELNGRRGHFPFTHVQVMDDEVSGFSFQ